MTEVQKEILIAKILDSPSCLSDEEVGIILHDDEMRDIYEISAAVNGSVRASEMALDVDDEWSRFRARYRKNGSPLRWIVRTAAVISGIILVSLLAGFLIFRISPADETKVIAKADPAIIIGESLPAIKEEYAPAIPAEAEKPAKPITKTRKAPRKESAPGQDTIEIDIDEYLRIQQAAIDNEIALQTARIIKEEYEVLAPESMDGYDTYNIIRKLTVQ